MGGAGVSVELDLCGWGRMLKSDSVKEGLLGLLKSFLLLLSPRENFYSSGWSAAEVFLQEGPEEVEQPQELADILFTSGRRIVSDGCCMFW